MFEKKKSYHFLEKKNNSFIMTLYLTIPKFGTPKFQDIYVLSVTRSYKLREVWYVK